MRKGARAADAEVFRGTREECESYISGQERPADFELYLRASRGCSSAARRKGRTAEDFWTSKPKNLAGRATDYVNSPVDRTDEQCAELDAIMRANPWYFGGRDE